jgi:antitoxin VapB
VLQLGVNRGIYHWYLPAKLFHVTEPARAKIFKHGRSQAVRLPKEFRLPGTEVSVRRVGRAVLLEPVGEPFDVDAWFARLDEYRDMPFMAEGREQPPMPPPRKIFDDE